MALVKFTFKSTLLISLLLSLAYLVDPLFLKNDFNYYKYNLFYKRDNVDVLVLGNSHADSGINYKILQAKSGLDSYNLSFESTNICQTYYNLLEAIRTQNPKLVIIENHIILSTGVDDNFLNPNGSMNFKHPKSLYGKKISFNKYNEAKKMFNENALYNTFNVLKFHDNWTDLIDYSQFLTKVNSKDHQQNYNGYATKTTFLSKQRQEKIKNGIFDKISIISEDEKTYLNKIIQLSKQNKFEVLLVTVPFYNEYYKKTKDQYAQAYKTLDSIVSKHNNVKLLDVNTLYDFNYTYFINEKGKNYRNQHLNYKGSTKATNFIANFIESNFEIETDEDFKRNTIEDFAYQNINNKNAFEGNVTKVNRKIFRSKKETLTVISKESDSVKIEGWLYPKDNKHKNTQKFVVLKGSNDFIYVSLEREIKTRNTPLLLKKKGDAYKGSGYVFKVPKQILEKGTYDIFHGILTKKDLCYIENTTKKLIIE